MRPSAFAIISPAGHPSSSFLRMQLFKGLLPNHSSFFDGHIAFARMQRQVLLWAEVDHLSCARGSLTIKPWVIPRILSMQTWVHFPSLLDRSIGRPQSTARDDKEKR